MGLFMLSLLPPKDLEQCPVCSGHALGLASPTPFHSFGKAFERQRVVVAAWDRGFERPVFSSGCPLARLLCDPLGDFMPAGFLFWVLASSPVE